jgi:beta-galactosidase
MRREVVLSEVVVCCDSLVRVRSVVDYFALRGKVRNECLWSFRGDGTVVMEVLFVPTGDLPALPRLGMGFVLSPGLEFLSWLGHGPGENYADRLSASPVGVYRGCVSEQNVPYPRPQETGNREGIRWISIKNSHGRGLRFTCLSGVMAGSAMHFTAGDLAVAQHVHELRPRQEVFLSLDAAMLGLGNGSCGPGVLKKYALPNAPHKLSVLISRLTINNE